MEDNKQNKAQPTKTKRKRRTKAEMLKAKQTANLVPGNVDDSFMISKTAREDCYVYAVKRVKFDPILGTAEESKVQLISYRLDQVHKAAIWDKQTGEIIVNTRHEQLKVNYGINNVVLVNDPYEYE
jgi:hypothetical protein